MVGDRNPVWEFGVKMVWTVVESVCMCHTRFGGVVLGGMLDLTPSTLVSLSSYYFQRRVIEICLMIVWLCLPYLSIDE